MAKKTTADDGSRTVAFRSPAELSKRLDEVAEALGLDVSNLVRMVLHENLYIYEQRVKEMRRAREEGPSS